MQQWAFYAYDAKAGETKLKDLKIIENSSMDTRVIVGYDAGSNSIITSFRGSSDIQNFLTDADAFKVSYVRPGCSNCNVHKGFYNAYNSLQSQLTPYVQTMRSKYPSATVVVTGHSLGAAEALLGAVDQQQLGYSVHVYTYGCPRTGDQNFVNFFDNLISATNLRAWFINDPVPTLPGHFMGYDHVGTEVHFYDCKNYLVYPKFTDDYPYTDVLAIDDHSDYRCLTLSTTAEFIE